MVGQPYGIQPPRFRLPDATRLGAVTLQVSDLNQSLVYYERVLGLVPIARAAGVASLAPVGESRGLVHLRERPGAHAVARNARLGLYHFAILLPDRAALGRFVAHLSEIGAAAASADHAVSEAIYLWDPDGLGIEVYVDRPRSAWRVQGRELFMTTERLDLRNLVTAAGGERWRGMPVGTILGHMHLHVGDLAQASAFYHVALGFDQTVWSFPGALFLAAGGYHHHLGTNTWAAGASPAADDEAKLLEWEIVLPEVQARNGAAESLRAGGYAVEESGQDRLVSDPWGTTLRLTVAAR